MKRSIIDLIEPVPRRSARQQRSHAPPVVLPISLVSGKPTFSREHGRPAALAPARSCAAEACSRAARSAAQRKRVGGSSAGHPRFARPIVVQVGRPRAERIVFDVNDVATTLLRVSAANRERKIAMDTCLQVLRGGAHPAVAWRAFVAAALEARILRSD
ncbi:DUF982 domain-containing protein [Mesorhizobium sp. BHbsci]